jgi:p-hydroxybenzoate 3-monooxygenase
MRTQVGIIGAGPSGLMLAQLLRQVGIESVIIEQRSRPYIENRIRAGVLEYEVAQLLRQTGVGARMDKIGLPHGGTSLLFGGEMHRIDFRDLTGNEVVRDLVAARVESGAPLLFECSDVAVEGFASGDAKIHFVHDGRAETLHCDFIAGCDGFHGVCRPSMPDGHLTFFDRVYPFSWLGILADAPPSAEELIYANHENGFALLSMRSPTVSRLYIQCDADEDLAEWPDHRIWEELDTRLQHPGFHLNTGKITQKGITPMRSFVTEPMQCGALFLVGDAAHIVPPTGAKGLNSAMADAVALSRALELHYAHKNHDGLENYSKHCLRRIWKVQRFSWWMTTMLHKSGEDGFSHRLQLAELDYVASSRTARKSLAENYVGLPL